MICNQCGTQNPEGVQFCRQCGAKLQPVPTKAAAQQPQQVASQQPQSQPALQQSVAQQRVKPSPFTGFFVKDQASANMLSRTAVLGVITSVLAIIAVFIPFLTLYTGSATYSFSSLLPFGNASVSQSEGLAATYNSLFGGAGWLIFLSVVLLLAGAAGILLSIHYYLQPCCKNKLHNLLFNCVYFVILLASLYLMSILWVYVAKATSSSSAFAGPAVFFFFLAAMQAFELLVWHPAPITKVTQNPATKATPVQPAVSQQSISPSQSPAQQSVPQPQSQPPAQSVMPQQVMQQPAQQAPVQQPPQNPGAPTAQYSVGFSEISL